MDYLEKARRVIALEMAEVQRLLDRLDGSFVEAVETIRRCIENRGKVVVVGVGKSGNIGEKIAATLTSTGSPAVVLNSLNALHGDLGVVADGDVILALSFSGETDELVNIVPALSRFEVRIIAMTGNAQSFLAKNSHVHLDVNIEQEACPLNLAPTSSTTVMLVLGDALAMVLLEARGFRKEDFARFHPGGRLGRALLTKVSQIMRGAEQMAIVRPEISIHDALLKMADVRAGLAVVLDDTGALAGIFTQGDLGRHLREHSDLLQHPVSEFMARRPVTIRADKLAVEVLHLIEQYRIDDVVVVDENDRPVGVVDSQDLARYKLV
ncbi:MAG TPA: KpsF/GutQ family sugar-phosphate isomerase [Chthoniobacter sp.]|jgi:arabinose-5-phosphate isomerase